MDTPAGASSEPPPVRGVRVAARLDGRVVASAARVGPDPVGGRIRAAALDAARDLGASVARDRVALSVELTGALIPIQPGSLEELTVALSPGLDGLAMSRGERFAAVFPGEFLARGITPGLALTRLATELGSVSSAALTPPEELLARGYRLYRFRTTHLAQPGAGLGAVFLHRGGSVASSPSTTTLRVMSDAMAAYLMRARWPGVEPHGVLGTRDPTTGGFDTPFAGPTEQAIAAAALARFGRLRPDSPIAERARTFAAELLASLHEVTGEEQAPWASIPSAAACVIAIAELDPDARAEAPVPELLDRCRTALAGAYEPGAGEPRAFAFTDAVPAGAQGMVAYALVRDAAIGSDALTPKQLDGALRAVYRSAGPRNAVAHMPWLGWAELDLARIRGAEDLRAAQALQSMRAMVWEHQLRARDLGPDDRDLAGGVVFTRASTPLPTWHTLRPIAFLATMLRDERLTPGTATSGSAPAELLRLIESMRFVRQLMPDDRAAHMYVDPGRAFGGVRAAPWDQRISIDATALGLLATTEAARSLEALGQRASAAP